MKRTIHRAANLCFLALLLLTVLTAAEYLQQHIFSLQASTVYFKLLIGGVLLCSTGLVCLGSWRS